MDEEITVDENFPLFSRKAKSKQPSIAATVAAEKLQTPHLEKETNPNPNPNNSSFADLGLSEWAVQTCKELGMKKPTPVQHHCIPRILSGEDVLGLAQTGSGKTAAFALPILHRLAEDPYGVFALVVTPTRELAYQLAEQFRALGACLNLRCAVVVGGMDKINQTQALMNRPHVVIATPGRIKVLIEENPDIPAVFSKTKSLRLAALHRFKSGKVPVLLATDVASRGLDIPTVDLVINYDIPRYPRDYVHRVGRTARAGRGGLAVSFVTQNDVNLIHEIEDVLGKQLGKFECKENDVLADITKVYKAKRVATMKMEEDGFEEKAKARKEQKLKMLAEKGLLKKRKRGRAGAAE